MLWVWQNSQALANVATVLAAVFAIFGLGIAVGQYWSGGRLHRRTLAHEKLSAIYEIGIQHPLLASGYFDVSKLDRYEDHEEEIEKYLWVYSAIEANLEYLLRAHGKEPGWRETIKYNVAAHRDFILSDWHADNGWWSTYDPRFRSFVAREVFNIPADTMREWAAIQPPLVPPYSIHQLSRAAPGHDEAQPR